MNPAALWRLLLAALRLRGKRRHLESLSANHGYFFTIKRTLLKLQTRYQSLELVESEAFGRVLLLDGIAQLFETREFQYHEALAHPALSAHPDPRSVLIIGGGDGGVLRQVCRHRSIERIDLVDLDGEVVEVARRWLPGVHGGSFDDPRVHITIGDGRQFVEGCRKRYDVILMDMTDPSGPSCLLYTQEFFRSVRRALRDRRSIFSMHAESAEDRPLAYTSILRTLRSVFGKVRPMHQFVAQYGTLWALVHASPSIDVAAVPAATIDRRLRQRRVGGLQLYNGAVHHSMAVSRPYINRIVEQSDARLITDAAPDFPDAFE
ncbi:MAG: polyamine aminopropyltransferase [Leptospirales bacterium]|nr:polyamine aminopropyltransferase [Leptospirales bacterium]